ACYVPYYDRFMFFLMVYSNLAQGETIQFRFYDASDNIVYYIPTEVVYQSNAMVGTVETPWQFIARPMRVGDPSYVPEEFTLSDCFPNPFNGVTKIGYGIPQKCQVQIVIYNMLGHKVRTLVVGEQLPGYRFITWDGLNDQGQSVASGIYLIEITAGNPARGVRYGLHKVNKMTLLK
ncbi:MAG: FlgD immunoglobulin-like domain containing protein, partial [Candidatus Zhuqueibacterota bacterium]